MRSEPSLPERIDRYDVIGLLGVGAFAAVYEAVDPALDQSVALKVLGDHHAADPDTRERFVREARLLRGLSGNADGRLVVVHDIGEWNHQPFIVMELITGGTLADWLTERGPLSHDGSDVRWLIDEIAACLRVAHAGGVTHRDVKPTNFLLRTGEGGERLVLGDFGLARELDASRLTVAGGTDHYMAPEQRQPSVDVDQRADIHAASVLVGDSIESPSTRLDAVLARGRAADPSERPPDIDRWRTGLLAAIDNPGRAPGARRRVLALLSVILIACAAVGLALSRTSERADPIIDGPQQLVLGEIGMYRHDDRDDADYRWEDSDGRVFGADDAPSVEIKPVDTGVYELTLIETIGDEERRAIIDIDVVAP